MPVLMSSQAAGVESSASVSSDWRYYAVLIAVVFVMLLFVGTSVVVGGRNSRAFGSLFRGDDGMSSTSKFQWLAWLAAVLFAYVALWILRASTGHYGAIQHVPTNVLTVLGFSSVTMATAKGIKVSYLSAQKVTPAPPGSTGGLVKDDNGVPELAKLQIVGFTLVALGIFLATVVHEIATANVGGLALPDIDTSLLALMGISQGGYLAKKLVTIDPAPTGNVSAMTAVATTPGLAAAQTQAGEPT